VSTDGWRGSPGHDQTPCGALKPFGLLGKAETLANPSTRAVLSGAKLKPDANVDLSNFVRKRIRFEGSSLRSRDEQYQGKLRDQLVDHALPKFKDGSFKVFVEKVFSWEDIQEAHRLMESNQTKGKLICVIE